MKYKKTIFVSEQDAKTIEKYLAGEEFQHEDNTISFTASFDDGHEVDVKCCGACLDEDEKHPSWTEAVLFNKGCEVCCSAPCDSFFGEWELNYGGNTYSVSVVAVDSTGNAGSEMSEISQESMAYALMVKEAEKFGWTLTDDDDFQWQREIIDTTAPLCQTYEMCQIISLGDKYAVCHGNVRVGALPFEELDALVGMYGYESLDDFVQQTSASNEFLWNEDGSIDRENSPAWILEYPLLAEMDFETQALTEYLTDLSFSSYVEAEYFIKENILKKHQREVLEHVH